MRTVHSRRDLHRSTWRSLLHAMVISGVLLATCSQAARVQEGNIYISGPKAPLYEAFGQALGNNALHPARPFWIIATGIDIIWVTKAAVDPGIHAWIRNIRERHGHIYVCKSDMAFYGIDDSALLTGIATLPTIAGRIPSKTELRRIGIVVPRSRVRTSRMLNACANRTRPTQLSWSDAHTPAA